MLSDLKTWRIVEWIPVRLAFGPRHLLYMLAFVGLQRQVDTEALRFEMI